MLRSDSETLSEREEAVELAGALVPTSARPQRLAWHAQVESAIWTVMTEI